LLQFLIAPGKNSPAGQVFEHGAFSLGTEAPAELRDAASQLLSGNQGSTELHNPTENVGSREFIACIKLVCVGE